MNEDKPTKSYYVRLQGFPQGEIWDEDKFNRNKDKLFNDHKTDVTVFETSPLALDAEISDNDLYTVHVPGFPEAEGWDGAKLARNREQLLKDHPDVEISRTSVVDYWGDKLRGIYDQIQTLEQERDGLPGDETGDIADLRNMDDQDLIQAAQKVQPASVRRKLEIRDELNRLYQMRTENPAYQRYMDAERQDIAESLARVGQMKKADTQTRKGPSSLDRALSAMDDDYLRAAQSLYEDAQKAANAPSRFEGNGWDNFWKGVADTGWSALSIVNMLKQLQTNIPLLESIQRIQENEGKDVNVYDLIKNHPDQLTYMGEPEKEMLRAFIKKADMEGGRSKDLSLGYQAGQSAAQSLGFMADFLMSGGVGDKAAEAVTGTMLKKAGRNEIAKLGVETLGGTVKALAMTPFMPSTYANFVQNLAQFNDAGGVDLSGRELLKQVGDVLVENVSETIGSKPLELIGKPLSKVAFPNWAKALRHSPIAQTLKQAGYNGFFEEMFEEWTGNALRVMTGVDKNALKDFATIDQQLITAASFAPMSVVGLPTSAIQYRTASKAMRDRGVALQDIIDKSSLTDAQKKDMLAGIDSFQTPEDLAHHMTDVYRSVVDAGAKPEDAYKAVMDYTEATARYNVMTGLFDEQRDIDRSRRLTELDQQMGNAKWHHEGRNGASFVRIITDADGNERFVSAGQDGNLALVDREGNRSFMSELELAAAVEAGELTDSGEQFLFDYIDKLNLSVKKAEEAERVQQEAQQNTAELLNRVQQGINIGTEQDPEIVREIQVDKIITQDAGGVHEYSYQQMGDKLGIRLMPETDEEKEAKAAALEERHTEMRQALSAQRGKTVTIDGQDYTLVGVVGYPSDTTPYRVIVQGADGEHSFPFSDEDIGQLARQLDEAPLPEPAVEVGDDVPRDFRGNPLPMRQNEQTGEQVVDEDALRRKDIEAWVRYNDANPARKVSSRDWLTYNTDKLSKAIEKAAGALRKAALDGVDEREMDKMESELAAMNQTLASYQSALEKYTSPDDIEGDMPGYLAGEPAQQAQEEKQASGPVDFRGRPIPLDEGGEVDEGRFFQESPEAWMEWNTAQMGDEGEDSKGYVKAEISRLSGQIGKLEKGYKKEADFKRRKEIRGQIEDVKKRITDLGQALKNVEGRRRRRAARELEPQTVDEVIANGIAAFKGSIDRDELKRETGMSDADLQGFVGGFVKEGGMSIGALAEQIKATDDTGITSHLADDELRSDIIEFLQGASKWSDITNYIANKRTVQKSEEERQAQEAIAAAREESTHQEVPRYQLSDEVDENGRQFVLNSKGEIEFGRIPVESGLTSAPILLSEGEITNPATNDGYGLVHIEARHGEQIRNAGFTSVIEFIENVAQNYEVIRKGKDRDGNQTYMLQLTDKHNNTLMVELSGDGTYWNINTAGIFKTSYGAKRDVVYNRPTSVKQPVETVEATQEAEQGDTDTSSSRNNTPTQLTENKDSEISETQQKISEKKAELSEKQQEIAAAEAEVDTEPTEAQKEAGNYKKGHIKLDGYDITIEQPKGSVRSGVDAQGREWSQVMNNTYGYIRGTEGVDGDHIDVFLSDNPEEGNVFVVDQVKPDGSFDEHKVMYGFPDMEAARAAYLSNYEEGWTGLGAIAEVSRDEFKKWVESSHRKTKPFSEYKTVKTEGDVRKEGVPADAAQGEPSLRDKVRGIIEQSDGNPELADRITDEEMQRFSELYDAWQAESERADEVYRNNQKASVSPNKKFSAPAKKAIKDATEAAERAGLPLVEYYQQLAGQYGLLEENSAEIEQKEVEIEQEPQQIEQKPAEIEQKPEKPHGPKYRERIADILSGKDKTRYKDYFFTKTDYPDEEYDEVVRQWDEYKRQIEEKRKPLQQRVSSIVSETDIEAEQEILEKVRSQGKTIGETTLYNVKLDVTGKKLKNNAEYQRLIKEIDALDKQTSPSAKEEFRQNAIGMLKAEYAKQNEQAKLSDHTEDALKSVAEEDAERQEARKKLFEAVKRLYEELNEGDVLKNDDGGIIRIVKKQPNLRGYEVEINNSNFGGTVPIGLADMLHYVAEEGYYLDPDGGKAVAEEQALAADSVTIEPAQYTRKDGKTIDMFRVNPGRELSHKEWSAVSKFLKEKRGWKDRENGGFMVRSEEDARALADLVRDDKAMNEARPVSLTDMQQIGSVSIDTSEVGAPKEDQKEPVWKYELTSVEGGRTYLSRSQVMPDGTEIYDGHFDVRADNPKEMKGILQNNGMYDTLSDFDKNMLDRKIEHWQFRQRVQNEGINGLHLGDKVMYKGKEAIVHDFEEYEDNRPVLDTGLAPVIYEVAESWDAVQKVEAPAATPAQEATAEQPKTERPVNPSGNKLVTDERYAELRRRMMQKLGGQMNLGIDPEILAIGTEMAVYHIEKGARKFVEYAKAMIADLSDAIRPYLKAFYNGARDLPEIQESGLAAEMDSYDTVQAVDTANFDKETANVLSTVEMIEKEAEVEEQAQQGAEKLQKVRNTVAKDVPATEQEARRRFSRSVATEMIEAVSTGVRPFESIVDLRKLAEESGMALDRFGSSDILLQELVEDGLVTAARDIIESRRYGGMKSREAYDAIVRLYEMQPSINQRSSNRIKMQQYSTPLPMAFVADMFAFHPGRTGSVLEPTAGNGMLVFAIPANRVHANELDETRLANLCEQGFREVTSQDGAEPFSGKYDAVIANPPFGSREAREYDGVSISGLDPQIALNALESMNDEGKAAIIVGGNLEYASNGALKGGKKAFFSYLYDHYNVKGIVDMSGDLYKRQGTKFPTMMILIDGRRSEEERAQTKVYPPVKSAAIAKVNNFDELYDTIVSVLQSKQKTNGYETVRTQELGLFDNHRPSGETGVARHGVEHHADASDERDRRERGNVRGGGNRRDGRDEDGGVQRTENESGGRTYGLGYAKISGPEGRPDGREAIPDSGSSDSGRRNADVREGGERISDDGTGRNDVGSIPTSGTSGRGVGVAQPSQPKSQQPKEERKLTDEKLHYVQHSSAFSLESVAPAAMVEAMDAALGKIETKYGKTIDEFVTDELGYDSVESMHSALAAEQVDSVAMAIDQMKQGQALVIGDQTGAGKGRQMAALIRWAVRQGKQPVFFTKTADLFTDIYRDLVDIGSGELNPFIFNAVETSKDQETGQTVYGGGVMQDANGKIVHRALPSKKQLRIFESGELPAKYDFAVLTYTQVNTGDAASAMEAYNEKKKNGARATKPKEIRSNPKADFLRKIAKENYLFLDESHTAAGDSKSGYFLQSLVKDAEAVTFASATFAKRPDTMPLYALRTAMSKAQLGEGKSLIGIIKRGGVTLQEIMSRALTAAGQMVRRERDMSDVQTDWETVTDPETVKKARVNYDKTIEAFNDIINFQTKYVTPMIDALSGAMALVGSTAQHKKGTKKMGIENIPFASKTYNYTKQLMLALKTDAIVDRVVAEIQAGRHPVIALESTMEGLLKEYMPGDVIENPTFAASLLRGLDTVMQYTVTDENGHDTHRTYSPAELGEEGERAYYELRDKITEATSDIFLSPIDAIINGLKERGYKVGELTGRSLCTETNEDGDTVVRKRTDTDKLKLMRDFNSGALDVVILNKSAATGISLHASKKFKDQRQRSMIIAQPLSDINDYMQMIGRIDRTGQVSRGYYINLALPVPAEQRFNMMLSTKLKSLNANTTTSQDSESSSVDAPDLLNKYGSQVVVEYLRDNPDIYRKLGSPLKDAKGRVLAADLDEYKPGEEDARKITGYVALLSTKEQQDFYDDVIRRYNDLINYLNETGTNDLRITVMPLEAKTVEKSVSSEGTEPDGDNPFATHAFVEKVEMNVLSKPMTSDEIRKAMKKLNGDKSGSDRRKEILKQLHDESEAKLKSEDERYETAKVKAEEDIAKRTALVMAKEKMTDEEKKDAIEHFSANIREKAETTHEENRKKFIASANALYKRMMMFNVGETYLIADNLGTGGQSLFSSPAIFLGFKAKESKITASTTIAVFAPLDGRRRIEVKMSDMTACTQIHDMTEMNYHVAKETTLANWDSQIPNETRKTGYILTGNILQAIADTSDEFGNYTGQLVSFTDDEGNVRDGILMPDQWTPALLPSAGVPINARAKEIEQGRQFSSTDGDITIKTGFFKHDGKPMYYQLSVPKTKAKGGKFFLDEDLLSLLHGGEFTTRSGKMQATIFPDNLKAVLNKLAQMGVRVADSAVHNREADQNAEKLDVSDPLVVAEASAALNRLARRLNLDVHLVIDANGGEKGYYQEGNNFVTINLNNCESVDDAVETLLHEGVAHYGLRQLLGNQGMKEFIADVLKNASGSIRYRIQQMADERGWSLEYAAEEYIAELAEKTDYTKSERSFWRRLLDAVRNFIDIITGRQNRISDDTIREMLVASFDNLENNVNLQSNGERPNENQDDERTDSGRVAGNRAGRDALRSDRGDIRMYEAEMAAERHDDNGDPTGFESRRDEAHRLIGVAKENGTFIPVPKPKGSEFGEELPMRSRESSVFRNMNTGKVTKFKDPFALLPMKQNAVQDAIYEHLVHNYYFPDTRYAFKGVSALYGDEVRFVLEQDYVDWSRRATQQEVEDYLNSVGLTKQDGYWYGNDLISVTDVEKDNVLVDANGVIRFIDPVIRFNKPAKEVIETLLGYGTEKNTEQGPVRRGVGSRETRVRLVPADEEARILGEGEGITHFSIRTKPAPKKTGIGYKVFYRGKDGKLYPPMVANPNGEDTPVGVWLDADAAPVAGQSKTGRPQVKAGGKGTQGGSGTLAYRPGWHLGEIPYAIQFNRLNPETGQKDLFPRDFVWAEVEYAADNDYQKEADAEGVTYGGKYRHSYAGLKRVPEDGFYRYRTNPNPETDPWIITGAMKVNRILTDEEVDDMVRAAGREPQMREGSIPASSPVGYRQSLAARRQAIEETAAKVGVQVEIRPSKDMFDDGKPLAGRWFNGKMYICPEHCRDTDDAIRTVLHEGVGHNGLRRLIGNENMRNFCLDMFRRLPKEARDTIAKAAVEKYGANIAEAVEEYLAERAEVMDFENEDYERGFWDIVRDGLRMVLSKIGINIPLSEHDVRWLMWQSYNANKQDDLLNYAKRQVVADHLGFSLRQQEGKAEAVQLVRNREAEDRLSAARLYNRDVLNMWSRLHETWVDKDEAVHKLVEAIEKASGKATAAFEDVRLSLNQQSSKGLAAIERFERRYFDPMKAAIKSLMKEKGCSLADIERYVMLKHGLERNEVFAKRDAREYYQDIHDKAVKAINSSDSLEDEEKKRRIAKEDEKLEKHKEAIKAGTDGKYREFREQDYGGLTAMYSDFDEFEPFDEAVESNEEYQARVLRARHPRYDSLKETEQAAEDEVSAFEEGSDKGIEELWKRINAATKHTLKHQYDANMLSRDQYLQVRDMFKYYVPLRGFADNTAEDMYDYYRSDQRSEFTPPLLRSKGRETEAESPFGYIGSMASSGIAADMKNETKLALYYFVLNRPNDLVTVSEVWYEKVGEDGNGKGIFEPVYPPLDGDLTSEAAKEAFIEWEKGMREKAKSGLAFKGRRNLDLRNSVIHIDKRQKDSHIIKFKVGGRDMMMYINGNPRAAQAINNELNVEMSADYQRFFGRILRWFSGINTSYNPEFWLSNAQRDSLFAMMSVNVKEDPAYNRAFRRNFGQILAKTLTPGVKGGAYSLLRKLERGELGDSRMERLYQEFVENGGVTGYTTLKDNEEWELELRKYTGEGRKAMEAVRTAFGAVQKFGEAIEQMTRFVAFVTSREQGREIKHAVSDAKELTVNFNRKGSGKAISFKEAEKLRTRKGKKLSPLQKAFVVGASWLPVYGRRFIMFFNAAVQGLNSMYKLYKKDPAKMGAWTAGYLALGVMQAVLHAMMDDDDDYLDIPDYERRTNLLIGGKGVYFKWALPQEARVFYAIGDMAVNHAMGREPHREGFRGWAGEIGGMLGDIAPLNPAGGISALAPSALAPIVEVIQNRDYKGAKIYNDMKYLSDEEKKRTPAYQKAFQGTGRVYVLLSQVLNSATGGDYADAGIINVNPAVVEHVLKGVTGGAGTTLGKLYRGTIGQAFGEDFTVRNTPFLSRIITVNDDRYRNAHTTELFNFYSAEAEHTKQRINTYRKNGDIDKLNDIYESGAFEIMRIYDSYKRLFKYYNDELKATTDSKDRKAIMREQDAVRKEMIMEISNIGKND